MKNCLGCILLALLVSSPALAAQTVNKIVLNATESGYPPYFIKNGSNEETGIIIDVLRYIGDKHQYQIVTKSIPKKRITQHIKLGTIDANATAIKWVTNPENYVFTDIVVTMRDVFYSLKASPIYYKVPADLVGKTLSTHLGYKYPLLDAQINNKQIKTIDEYSELLMLKNVLSHRSDAAIINEVVGSWIINKNPSLHHKFVVSDTSIGSVGYRIMFLKKWQGFVDTFNRELKLMKKNGELNKILNKYR